MSCDFRLVGFAMRDCLAQGLSGTVTMQEIAENRNEHRRIAVYVRGWIHISVFITLIVLSKLTL